jgi:hypothetical protein
MEKFKFLKTAKSSFQNRATVWTAFTCRMRSLFVLELLDKAHYAVLPVLIFTADTAAHHAIMGYNSIVSAVYENWTDEGGSW